MKTPELKPCPFCGSRPTVNTWGNPNGKVMYQVLCDSAACAIQPMTDYHTNEESIVREWNRRAKDENA